MQFAKIVLLASFFTLISFSSPAGVKIAIIQPIQHRALDEIARGFKEALLRPNSTKSAYSVEVLNAQGDINTMRTIILQQVMRGVDIIAPIGGNTSRMAEKIVAEKGNQQQKMIALAVNSEISFSLLKDRGRRVIDEIPVSKSLDQMKSIIPNIKKIAVIHSADERLARDLEQLTAWAKTHGVVVQRLLVQNHQDIFSSAKAIQSNVDALFILKDHLVVSAIRTIKKVADERKIPLVASDEGSVIDGAHFALGVSESEIGVLGAKLAVSMLKDLKSAEDINLAESAYLIVNPSFKASLGDKVKFRLVTTGAGS